jgi:hypothetical protein
MRGRSAWRTERRFESDLSRYAAPTVHQSSEDNDENGGERHPDGRPSNGKVAGKLRFPDGSDSDEDEIPGAYAVTRVNETGLPIEDAWDPTERMHNSPLFDDEPASSNDALQTAPDSIADAEIPRVSNESGDIMKIKAWRSRRCILLILFMLIGIWAIGGVIGYLSMTMISD